MFRMLVRKILARITQHAKLGLQTEIITVSVLVDLDLKAMIVIVFLVRQKNDALVISSAGLSLKLKFF